MRDTGLDEDFFLWSNLGVGGSRTVTATCALEDADNGLEEELGSSTGLGFLGETTRFSLSLRVVLSRSSSVFRCRSKSGVRCGGCARCVELAI